MVTRSYMSRREVEQQRFSMPVTVLVPVGAVLLQVLLPRVFAGLAILDLPFVVTLFFAISRRSPIAGTATGAAIGLLQDVLTGQPIGVNGMAKSLIGYAGRAWEAESMWRTQPRAPYWPSVFPCCRAFFCT